MDLDLTAEQREIQGLAREFARDEIEPHAAGLRALWCPTTGIIDFRHVALALAEEVRARLIAVNANTGDIAWQSTLGITEGLPEGKRNVGANGSGGPIATAGGLVFIGATNDNRFRAFDSKKGTELWTTKLDYSVTAVPMSYQGKNGKQYVAVVAAGPGRGNNQSLIAFALP